jgi:2,5-diamino-6-(ribosylamino)-4(3H)-pyrimidinone 5'-phosphate reductase
MPENLSISVAEKMYFGPYLSGGQHDQTLDGDSKSYANRRPFVTLTYAQSLDGMISLGAGLRTTLSGPETKAVTHFLRNNHDAILVGSGTAVVDDPSLNSRYNEHGVAVKHPIPVIIDPNRRWNYGESKIARLARDGNGKEPIIVRHRRRDHEQPAFEGDDYALTSHEAFATPPTKKIDWAAILNKLSRRGIKTVMIEGGATVINDLLARPHLVDTVIITIAPTYLGSGGIVATPPPKTEGGIKVNAVNLTDNAWRQFGKDVVMCGKLKR